MQIKDKCFLLTVISRLSMLNTETMSLFSDFINQLYLFIPQYFPASILKNEQENA